MASNASCYCHALIGRSCATMPGPREAKPMSGFTYASGTTHPKNHCIRCGTSEVKQRSAKDPNVCTGAG